MSNSPIFIGGQMKSGTTMLRMLLARHSNIFSGLETYWFNLDLYRDYDAPNNLSINKLCHFYDVDITELTNIIHTTSNNKKIFIQNFLEYCMRREKKHRWLEKTPDNIKKLTVIENNWEIYKFIHVLRDFRDIYASWKLSKKYNLSYFLDQVQLCYSDKEQLLGMQTEKYFEVKYEDLVTDSPQEIRKILKFLNEPFQERCTSLSSETSKADFAKVFEATGKKSTTLLSTQQPIHSSKIGHYKTILTSGEISMIEKELRIYFDKFCYVV